MKIRLRMKNISYTAVKTCNWYEDSFAYEKHFIHCCKNINWYEDLFAYVRRTFNTPLKKH